MKVALVNGSPHKNGCTYTALKEVAKTLNEEGIDTEIFWIGNKPIGGCIACKACIKTGNCVFDDSVNEFRKIAQQCDGFVFGTPVHYGAAGGNMTAFMDRLFYSDLCGRGNETFYMKPAACVISARRAGTTATFDQINTLQYKKCLLCPLDIGIWCTELRLMRWQKIKKVFTQ